MVDRPTAQGGFRGRVRPADTHRQRPAQGGSILLLLSSSLFTSQETSHIHRALLRCCQPQKGVHLVSWLTYPRQTTSPLSLHQSSSCDNTTKTLPPSHAPKTLSAAKIKQLNDPNAASTLDEVYTIVGEDFYVVIPCRSRRAPGVTSEGTRLTLVAQAPEGYEFTIRTPGTPPRWEHFAEELESCFQRLVDLLAAPPPPDRVFTTVRDHAHAHFVTVFIEYSLIHLLIHCWTKNYSLTCLLSYY